MLREKAGAAAGAIAREFYEACAVRFPLATYFHPTQAAVPTVNEAATTDDV